MSRIKAILFDMDGVLIDAKEWHYEALNRALSVFGMEISIYEHLMTFDGLPTKRKLEMISLKSYLPIGLHSFIDELKQQYTIEYVYALCRPKFHIQYALKRLKKEGFKIAVCSNSVRSSIDLMMERSGLSNSIDLILSNQDVENSKPNPEIYKKAMKNLRVVPEETLILEDNENGINAALSSGGNLLRITSTDQVNYANIIGKIRNIEGDDDID